MDNVLRAILDMISKTEFASSQKAIIKGQKKEDVENGTGKI